MTLAIDTRRYAGGAEHLSILLTGSRCRPNTRAAACPRNTAGALLVRGLQAGGLLSRNPVPQWAARQVQEDSGRVGQIGAVAKNSK